MLDHQQGAAINTNQRISPTALTPSMAAVLLFFCRIETRNGHRSAPKANHAFKRLRDLCLSLVLLSTRIVHLLAEHPLDTPTSRKAGNKSTGFPVRAISRYPRNARLRGEALSLSHRYSQAEYRRSEEQSYCRHSSWKPAYRKSCSSTGIDHAEY